MGNSPHIRVLQQHHHHGDRPDGRRDHHQVLGRNGRQDGQGRVLPLRGHEGRRDGGGEA